ncbi:gmp synthase [Purpureocillium lavendulum]|uniref:Gmp synthase n=1 Tax=Purpureocillium lavendulum TaxID=1247861 RepID=A0AB34FRV6_9HYPO|nr:gmp synthase [Purpureocillium lavendulum]
MAQHYQPDINAPTVRLMVLETDRPHPDTESDRGSFGAIVHDHFSKAGRAHHPPLGVQTDQVFVVTEEEGGRMPTADEFEGYDGLLITGSMYDAYGDNQWILDLLALLKELWLTRPDFHFTGVCFGHQLLARLLGATVAPAPSGDWELGHCRIDLTPTGQRLFRTRSPHVHLHQMHQDQVVAVPTAATAPAGMLDSSSSNDDSGGDAGEDQAVACWGRSSHTPVQGLYVPNRLFTTQAHLAFDEDMVRRQIQMRVDSGGIKDLEHADRAAETAHLEHDGVEVAKAILRLFVYDDDGMGYERSFSSSLSAYIDMLGLHLLLIYSIIGGLAVADPSPAISLSPSSSHSVRRPSQAATPQHSSTDPDYSAGDSEVNSSDWSDTSEDSGFGDSTEQSNDDGGQREGGRRTGYYIHCGKSWKDNVSSPNHCRRRGNARCEGLGFPSEKSFIGVTWRFANVESSWRTTENGWERTVPGSMVNRQNREAQNKKTSDGKPNCGARSQTI